MISGSGAIHQAHVVRRVGVGQMNLGAIEQAIHVNGAAAIAAKQSMVAEHPKIAGLGDRVIRRLGRGIRIGEPFGDARITDKEHSWDRASS